MELLVTIGDVRLAELWTVKSSPPTNQHLATKALKGKIPHSADLLIASSAGVLPTLYLTTKGSWLP